MSNEMLSINQRLKRSIDGMKKFHALESKKKNEDQQIKNDAKFKEAVHQTALLCQSVRYAQKELGFPYQPQSLLAPLLSDLEMAANKDMVNEDSITNASRKMKPINDQLKKEWAKHYPTLVSSVIGTLNIIQRIDPEHVNKCLQDLKSAEVWTNTGDDLINLEKLSAALSDSNIIIERLNLDQEIIGFLTKVSSNCATLKDLSDGILKWIHIEGLSDRIKVSFK